MSAHTPGPWHTNGNHINAPTPMGGLPVPLAHTVTPRGGTSKNKFANARLIAAAPELLAALEVIHAALNQPVQYTGLRTPASTDVLRMDAALARKMAHAALSKAKGGVQS